MAVEQEQLPISSLVVNQSRSLAQVHYLSIGSPTCPKLIASSAIDSNGVF